VDQQKGREVPLSSSEDKSPPDKEEEKEEMVKEIDMNEDAQQEQPKEEVKEGSDQKPLNWSRFDDGDL